jgi:secondary thiamine-phosphate synthase enzyme
VEARDITEFVQRDLRLQDGVVWVSSPHTTAAVLINEADENLLRDLERLASCLLDPLEPFSHARCGNPNASAHLVAALIGRGCLIRVSDGKLAMGPNQRVLVLELDGPKTRRLDIQPISRVTADAP